MHGAEVVRKVGVRVGSVVGRRVGNSVDVGAPVGLLVVGGNVVGVMEGGTVGNAVGGGVAAALQTALVIVPTDRERAWKPLVIAIACSFVGVETHGDTVLHRIPVPISSTITLIPAFLAAWNSAVGLSLGWPSVIMISTFGTPLRPLWRALIALRMAGTMFVPPR
jgi:hypothetical protein